MMSNTGQRLAMFAEILSVIDARRQATGESTLGAAIERFILESQFTELESDIMDDPGAFEAWLVRPRPATCM
jgi:hypothetical protein